MFAQLAHFFESGTMRSFSILLCASTLLTSLANDSFLGEELSLRGSLIEIGSDVKYETKSDVEDEIKSDFEEKIQLLNSPGVIEERKTACSWDPACRSHETFDRKTYAGCWGGTFRDVCVSFVCPNKNHVIYGPIKECSKDKSKCYCAPGGGCTDSSRCGGGEICVNGSCVVVRNNSYDIKTRYTDCSYNPQCRWSTESKSRTKNCALYTKQNVCVSYQCRNKDDVVCGPRATCSKQPEKCYCISKDHADRCL